MALYGKGYFLWQIPKVERGDPIAITTRAVDAGISHILIKIADGSNWVYNYDRDTKFDYVPPLQNALHDAGIQVWGWHYVRGDNPIGEARLAIHRMQGLRLDGYVVDAEKEYQKRNKDIAARRFMQEIRASFPDIPIALSSYRYPRVHHQLPFEAFLEMCDFAMPQVYFEQKHNPDEQLEICAEQYMSLNSARPIIPTGPTYSHAGWRPYADDITRFMHKAQEMGLDAVNFWSYDYATRPTMSDLWNAVSDYEWPNEKPTADMPERLIGRMNQSNFAHVADLYNDNAAHVNAARTVVGKQAIAHWYDNLLNTLLPGAQFEMTGKTSSQNTRHFTWTASSDKGNVLDGKDTIGLRDGRIQYHYTYFTISQSI